jgi:oxygen-independent coproporphyrinogen-3 oxidase
VIERLMCDGVVEVRAACEAAGFRSTALDGALQAARALERDGLCRVEGDRIEVTPAASRLVRAVAACFDAHLPAASPEAPRHAKAV